MAGTTDAGVTPRLPKTIALPLQYRIRVRVVGPDDVPAGYWSVWDEEARIIRLRRGRDPMDQWADLLHEMRHALADWDRHVEKALERAIEEEEKEENKKVVTVLVDEPTVGEVKP